MTWLDELQEKAEKATPGPWFACGPDAFYCETDKWESENWTVSPEKDVHGWQTDSGYSGYSISESNAKFIAAANPETVKLLVKIARAAKIFTDEPNALAMTNLQAALREGWVG